METAAEPGKSRPEIAPVRTVTVTERFTLPPAPEQNRLNVLVPPSGPTVSLPAVDLLPDQAPDAVQDVACADDQLSVVASFALIVVGAALSERVGTGLVTATVTERVVLPPAPVHVSEYVRLLVSGPVDWLPDVAFVPDQAPEAVHDAALADDQLRLEALPLVTLDGFAERETVGACAGGGLPCTVTVMLWVAEPPAPVHVSEKVLLLVSVPVD